MSYISTGMGDHLSALMFLIALRLMLVDQNTFWPCSSQNLNQPSKKLRKYLNTVKSNWDNW